MILMKEFVLYYQPSGPTLHDTTPIVLCVGTQERCEQMKEKLLRDPEFTSILSRERHGKLQITPSRGSAGHVPIRIRNYNARISAIGAVNPI